MASPTQWTWVWENSGGWFTTGKPGVLLFMGSQRVGYDWAYLNNIKLWAALSPSSTPQRTTMHWNVSSGIVFLFLYSKFFPTYVQNKTMTSLLLCFTSVVLYGWPLKHCGGYGCWPSEQSALCICSSSVPFGIRGFNHGWCRTVVFTIGKNQYISGPAQFNPCCLSETVLGM